MSSPKILIIDDSPINVVLIRGILETEGFEVIWAPDGAAGFAASRNERPDLILLDVIMPGESGFETCARLKSDESTSDIPIIFLSALDDVKSKVTGLKIGGVDYICKPVYRDEVLARVRVHLRIRETNRARIEEQRIRLDRLRDAQQAILANPEDIPEAKYAVYYEPLEETGGDFYDVVRLDSDVFGYFVADVSGHGVSASFVTSAIKALLRQYTGPLYSPEETMRGIGSVMREVLDHEQYLTACYARLNRRSNWLSVVSAGHPPAVVVEPGGQARTVEMDSDPLGLFSSVVLQRKDILLSGGERIYLYTDGMVEPSPGAPRKVGLERLKSTCIRHAATPLPKATVEIAQELRPAAGLKDDLLLLAIDVDRPNKGARKAV
ncbi:MAG: SpoIIE family protein phosphatase [Bryobacterales bacterium]|nr:SpoIIE family protein phosphatase [Bryobacterales bacterium]